MKRSRISLKTKILLSFLVVAIFSVVATSLMARQSLVVQFFEYTGLSYGMPGMGMHMRDMWRMMSPREEAFVLGINSLIIKAGLLGLAMGFLASLLVASQITRPIARMRTAALAMARGNFAQRVSWPEHDEMGDLAGALNILAESLEKAEQLRRNLVADVAHELRTPLATMQSYMEALRDGVIPASQENLNVVLDETVRLVRLINDLQDLSSLEARAVTLNRQAVDPGRLIEQVLLAREAEFRDKGMEVRREYPPEVPKVWADPDRLVQILHNLLSNACRYSPGGAPIEIKVSVEGGFLRTSISNTGIEIPHEDLGRVFDRFYRVDKSRSRHGGGSGLGLTITQKLVEAHDGNIHLASKDGETTVSFTLPLAGELKAGV